MRNKIIKNWEVIIPRLYGMYELECKKISGLKQLNIIESISIIGIIWKLFLNLTCVNFINVFVIKNVKYEEKIVDMNPSIIVI